MAEKKPKHTWTPNQPDNITLLFDTPFESEGQNGKYYQYTIEVAGIEKTCFASPDLHRQIQALGAKKGSVLNVTKYMEGSKFSGWHVVLDGDSYADVKSGDAPMKNSTTQNSAIETAPDWDAIDRRKQLNIIAGQAMNLAVKYVMGNGNETMGNVEDVPKYRDMFFKIMAEFVIEDPLMKKAEPTTETEKEDDLPF